MEVRAMITDFDGPINDSFREGLRRIEVLCGINNIQFTREKRRRLVEQWGIPGAKLMEVGLGIPESEAIRIYKQWEVYDLIHPISLVPGVVQTLNDNRLQGIKNTLLTSRNRDNVIPILDKHGILRDFSVVQTKQDWPASKLDQGGNPDPTVFDYTLQALQENFGITKEECVFVGDTPADVECSLAAGIEMVVVLTGPYWIAHFTNYPRLKISNILPSIDYFSEWLERYSEV